MCTVIYFYVCMRKTLDSFTSVNFNQQKNQLNRFFGLLVVSYILKVIYYIMQTIPETEIFCQIEVQFFVPVLMDFLLFILVLVPMLYFHRSTFKVIRDTTTRSPTQPLFSEVVTTEYEESNEDFQETKQLNTS